MNAHPLRRDRVDHRPPVAHRIGCGFGPLNNRFFPPMGSIIYWLRPGTIRLPPWPDRVPLTKGDSRGPVDVLLYGALVVMLIVALFWYLLVSSIMSIGQYYLERRYARGSLRQLPPTPLQKLRARYGRT